MAEQIGRDAAHQRGSCSAARPRNAIVECWHRFEQQAADAGLARHPWETSSEFTLRMLDLVEADSTPWRGWPRSTARPGSPSTSSTRRPAAAALAALDAMHRGFLGRAR